MITAAAAASAVNENGPQKTKKLTALEIPDMVYKLSFR